MARLAEVFNHAGRRVILSNAGPTACNAVSICGLGYTHKVIEAGLG